MLELEVIPERAVAGSQWRFVLGKFQTSIMMIGSELPHSLPVVGMHLAQAVDILKRQCTVIKNVVLRYSDKVYWGAILENAQFRNSCVFRAQLILT